MLTDSKFSLVVCAPVESRYDGLQHESSIDCDEAVDRALLVALDLELTLLWPEALLQ